MEVPVASLSDQDLRSVGEAHRNHGALAHSAAELVRVVVRPSRRIWHSDLFEQVDAPPFDLIFGNLVVRLHRLVDLKPNLEHRIERAQRILEDHRDVPPADVAQLVDGHPYQVLAFKENLAAHDPSRALHQAEDG